MNQWLELRVLPCSRQSTGPWEAFRFREYERCPLEVYHLWMAEVWTLVVSKLASQ